MGDITIIKDIFYIIGSLCGIFSLYLTWNRDKNAKINQYNSHLDNILAKLEDFLHNANEYWINSDISEGKRESIGNTMTSQIKNITIMIKRLKLDETSILLEELIELHKIATGGNFQSNPKIDKNKANLINLKSEAVKKTISGMYKNFK